MKILLSKDTWFPYVFISGRHYLQFPNITCHPPCHLCSTPISVLKTFRESSVTQTHSPVVMSATTLLMPIAGSCHAVDRHASAVHRSSIPPKQGWRRSWGIGRALAVPPGEETDYNSHQQCQNTSTCHSATATPGRPLLPTGTQCAANMENNALHTFP